MLPNNHQKPSWLSGEAEAILPIDKTPDWEELDKAYEASCAGDPIDIKRLAGAFAGLLATASMLSCSEENATDNQQTEGDQAHGVNVQALTAAELEELREKLGVDALKQRMDIVQPKTEKQERELAKAQERIDKVATPYEERKADEERTRQEKVRAAVEGTMGKWEGYGEIRGILVRALHHLAEEGRKEDSSNYFSGITWDALNDEEGSSPVIKRRILDILKKSGKTPEEWANIFVGIVKKLPTQMQETIIGDARAIVQDLDWIIKTYPRYRKILDHHPDFYDPDNYDWSKHPGGSDPCGQPDMHAGYEEGFGGSEKEAMRALHDALNAGFSLESIRRALDIIRGAFKL